MSQRPHVASGRPAYSPMLYEILIAREGKLYDKFCFRRI